jgi:hypothetical protein
MNGTVQRDFRGKKNTPPPLGTTESVASVAVATIRCERSVRTYHTAHWNSSITIAVKKNALRNSRASGHPPLQVGGIAERSNP